MLLVKVRNTNKWLKDDIKSVAVSNVFYNMPETYFFQRNIFTFR